MLELCLHARAHFGPWFRRHESLSGVDVGLCSSGGFISPAFGRDAVARWRPPPSAGPAVWLDREALRHMEPSISTDAVGDWLYEHEASVDPRAYHRTLRAACEAVGVRLLEGVSAASLSFSGQERPTGEDVPIAASVLTSNGREIDASAVILACGAWARELLPLASFPVKGQMLR